MKYGFIGVGNMGGAILRGLLHAGALNPEDVMVAGRTPERSAEQAQDFGVRAAGSRAALIASCDVIFVGVEPGTFPEILPEIAENFTQDKLLISMAAGITLDRIEETLGTDAKLIRIMPNTPAGVGEIMVSVSRNGNVSDAEVQSIVNLLSSIGKAGEVPEELIHAVIGVSGSSPAYTYMYIQGLAEAGEKAGMSASDARMFAAQAVLGAAKLVLSADRELEEMIDSVCTPGGTTCEAVNFLREHGFREIVRDGAAAAIRKSEAMSGGEKD
ncbi:pyrroline-5-carboxylate reductase [Hornefia butyriciproducens]|nr:pyrroline-5-carboxylate reductase [Hornefia butyriciproducens]